MAGHSKWHNIMHRKGRQDAKRGKLFTKAAKEIIIAAKEGGGDPEGNNRLRAAIAAAKAVNLPKDKIDNAIKKGTGEIAGGEVYETYYEGYGPGGIALLVEAATDNKNRTVAEIRHILSKARRVPWARRAAWPGCSRRRAPCTSPRTSIPRNRSWKWAWRQAPRTSSTTGDSFEVRTVPADFAAVEEAFEAAGMEPESTEMRQVPQNTIDLDVEAGRKLINLLEKLEDNDDVQNVHSNAELPEALLEEMDAD